MARVNLSLPDELAAQVANRLPDLNISRLLQDALRARLGCRHDALVCATCRAGVDPFALVDEALSRFYGDAMWDLQPLVSRGATAEGAARVLKSVAERHGITKTRHTPLPRPSRAERRAAKGLPLLAEDRAAAAAGAPW